MLRGRCKYYIRLGICEFFMALLAIDNWTLNGPFLKSSGKDPYQAPQNAVKEGDEALSRKIFEDKRFDRAARDPDTGSSVLHLSAKAGMASLAEAALPSEVSPADPNERDLAGFTPLHYACMCSDEEMARLPIYHGARPRIRSLGSALMFPSRMAAEMLDYKNSKKSSVRIAETLGVEQVRSGEERNDELTRTHALENTTYNGDSPRSLLSLSRC